MARDKLNIPIDQDLKRKFLFVLGQRYKGTTPAGWLRTEAEREVREYEAEHGPIQLEGSIK